MNLLSAMAVVCLTFFSGLSWTVVKAADLSTLTPAPHVSRAAEQEKLSFAELAALSLRASGVQESQLEDRRRQLQELLSRFQKRHEADLDNYEKGRNLLDFLHSTVLASYDRDQTEIDALLETGRHNCVSSGVVYMIMAEALGLQPSGVIVPDHAFVAVATERGRVDVETTSRYGFDPGSKQSFVDEFTQMTGFRYVPPGNYDKRQTTGIKRFIGLIYQNRIAALQRSGDHRTPAALAIDRYALDPKSRPELVKVLRNRALHLAESDGYQEGLEWVQLAVEKYELSEEFEETVSTFAHNLILEQIRSKEYEKAAGSLSKYSSSLSQQDRGELAYLLLSRKINQPLEEGEHSFNQLRDQTISYRKKGLLPADRATNVLLALYSKKINQLMQDGDFSQPLLLLRQADEELKEQDTFQQMLRTARKNAGTHYHNAMVPLLNSGRYGEARKIIEEGLELLPDSQLLRDDLEKIPRAQDR